MTDGNHVSPPAARPAAPGGCSRLDAGDQFRLPCLREPLKFM
jgi:hypothetical protein